MKGKYKKFSVKKENYNEENDVNVPNYNLNSVNTILNNNSTLYEKLFSKNLINNGKINIRDNFIEIMKIVFIHKLDRINRTISTAGGGGLMSLDGGAALAAADRNPEAKGGYTSVGGDYGSTPDLTQNYLKTMVNTNLNQENYKDIKIIENFANPFTYSSYNETKNMPLNRSDQADMDKAFEDEYKITAARLEFGKAGRSQDNIAVWKNVMKDTFEKDYMKKRTADIMADKQTSNYLNKVMSAKSKAKGQIGAAVMNLITSSGDTKAWEELGLAIGLAALEVGLAILGYGFLGDMISGLFGGGETKAPSVEEIEEVVEDVVKKLLSEQSIQQINRELTTTLTIIEAEVIIYNELKYEKHISCNPLQHKNTLIDRYGNALPSGLKRCFDDWKKDGDSINYDPSVTNNTFPLHSAPTAPSVSKNTRTYLFDFLANHDMEKFVKKNTLGTAFDNSNHYLSKNNLSAGITYLPTLMKMIGMEIAYFQEIAYVDPAVERSLDYKSKDYWYYNPYLSPHIIPSALNTDLAKLLSFNTGKYDCTTCLLGTLQSRTKSLFDNVVSMVDLFRTKLVISPVTIESGDNTANDNSNDYRTLSHNGYTNCNDKSGEHWRDCAYNCAGWAGGGEGQYGCDDTYRYYDQFLNVGNNNEEYKKFLKTYYHGINITELNDNNEKDKKLLQDLANIEKTSYSDITNVKAVLHISAEKGDYYDHQTDIPWTIYEDRTEWTDKQILGIELRPGWVSRCTGAACTVLCEPEYSDCSCKPSILVDGTLEKDDIGAWKAEYKVETAWFTGLHPNCIEYDIDEESTGKQCEDRENVLCISGHYISYLQVSDINKGLGSLIDLDVYSGARVKKPEFLKGPGYEDVHISSDGKTTLIRDIVLANEFVSEFTYLENNDIKGSSGNNSGSFGWWKAIKTKAFLQYLNNPLGEVFENLKKTAGIKAFKGEYEKLAEYKIKNENTFDYKTEKFKYVKEQPLNTIYDTKNMGYPFGIDKLSIVQAINYKNNIEKNIKDVAKQRLYCSKPIEIKKHSQPFDATLLNIDGDIRSGKVTILDNGEIDFSARETHKDDSTKGYYTKHAICDDPEANIALSCLYAGESPGSKVGNMSKVKPDSRTAFCINKRGDKVIYSKLHQHYEEKPPPWELYDPYFNTEFREANPFVFQEKLIFVNADTTDPFYGTYFRNKHPLLNELVTLGDAKDKIKIDPYVNTQWRRDNQFRYPTDDWLNEQGITNCYGTTYNQDTCRDFIRSKIMEDKRNFTLQRGYSVAGAGSPKMFLPNNSPGNLLNPEDGFKDGRNRFHDMFEFVDLEFTTGENYVKFFLKKSILEQLGMNIKSTDGVTFGQQSPTDVLLEDIFVEVKGFDSNYTGHLITKDDIPKDWLIDTIQYDTTDDTGNIISQLQHNVVVWTEYFTENNIQDNYYYTQNYITDEKIRLLEYQENILDLENKIKSEIDPEVLSDIETINKKRQKIRTERDLEASNVIKLSSKEYCKNYTNENNCNHETYCNWGSQGPRQDGNTKVVAIEFIIFGDGMNPFVRDSKIATVKQTGDIKSVLEKVFPNSSVVVNKVIFGYGSTWRREVKVEATLTFNDATTVPDMTNCLGIGDCPQKRDFLSFLVSMTNFNTPLDLDNFKSKIVTIPYGCMQNVDKKNTKIDEIFIKDQQEDRDLRLQALVLDQTKNTTIENKIKWITDIGIQRDNIQTLKTTINKNQREFTGTFMNEIKKDMYYGTSFRKEYPLDIRCTDITDQQVCKNNTDFNIPYNCNWDTSNNTCVNHPIELGLQTNIKLNQLSNINPTMTVFNSGGINSNGTHVDPAVIDSICNKTYYHKFGYNCPEYKKFDQMHKFFPYILWNSDIGTHDAIITNETNYQYDVKGIKKPMNKKRFWDEIWLDTIILNQTGDNNIDNNIRNNNLYKTQDIFTIDPAQIEINKLFNRHINVGFKDPYAFTEHRRKYPLWGALNDNKDLLIDKRYNMWVPIVPTGKEIWDSTERGNRLLDLETVVRDRMVQALRDYNRGPDELAFYGSIRRREWLSLHEGEIFEVISKDLGDDFRGDDEDGLEYGRNSRGQTGFFLKAYVKPVHYFGDHIKMEQSLTISMYRRAMTIDAWDVGPVNWNSLYPLINREFTVREIWPSGNGTRAILQDPYAGTKWRYENPFTMTYTQNNATPPIDKPYKFFTQDEYKQAIHWTKLNKQHLVNWGKTYKGSNKTMRAVESMKYIEPVFKYVKANKPDAWRIMRDQSYGTEYRNTNKLDSENDNNFDKEWVSYLPGVGELIKPNEEFRWIFGVDFDPWGRETEFRINHPLIKLPHEMWPENYTDIGNLKTKIQNKMLYDPYAGTKFRLHNPIKETAMKELISSFASIASTLMVQEKKLEKIKENKWWGTEFYLNNNSQPTDDSWTGISKQTDDNSAPSIFKWLIGSYSTNIIYQKSKSAISFSRSGKSRGVTETFLYDWFTLCNNSTAVKKALGENIDTNGTMNQATLDSSVAAKLLHYFENSMKYLGYNNKPYFSIDNNTQIHRDVFMIKNNGFYFENNKMILRPSPYENNNMKNQGKDCTNNDDCHSNICKKGVCDSYGFYDKCKGSFNFFDIKKNFKCQYTNEEIGLIYSDNEQKWVPNRDMTLQDGIDKCERMDCSGIYFKPKDINTYQTSSTSDYINSTYDISFCKTTDIGNLADIDYEGGTIALLKPVSTNKHSKLWNDGWYCKT